jgi:hypothetical protein
MKAMRARAGGICVFGWIRFALLLDVKGMGIATTSSVPNNCWLKGIRGFSPESRPAEVKASFLLPVQPRIALQRILGDEEIAWLMNVHQDN